jgi:glycerol-3-phosphate acyltransferase PlsY
MITLRFIIAILVGYLLGSIPSGMIVGRAFGVNVRQLGSGKTGATNVLRSAGWKAGLIVALADVLKGVIAVLLAQHLFARGLSPTQTAWMAALAGLAAIAGHMYPVYVGFKGGRGVATAGGMGLALAPPATLLALVCLIIPVAITRYMSLGSMIAATLLPFIYLGGSAAVEHGHLTEGNWAIFLALLVAGIIIVASHRDNIQRLLNGTERRLGEKAKPVQPAKR